jgi:hypothetical protein
VPPVPPFERLHQFVETAERLDQLLLFFAEMLVRQPSQPFLGQVADIDGRLAGHRLDTFEIMRENLVEAIDEALVLDQRRPREEVETLAIIVGYMLVHPLHQREKFPERDRDLRRLEFQEEGDEHRAYASSSTIAGIPTSERSNSVVW